MFLKTNIKKASKGKKIKKRLCLDAEKSVGEEWKKTTTSTFLSLKLQKQLPSLLRLWLWRGEKGEELDLLSWNLSIIITQKKKHAVQCNVAAAAEI